ncbi:baculoviral IAP repeat-containing protein 5.2-B-like [Phlebotomus argentipes]|uniref:baculoviral IAP repeat-containing protein 5.2-B-like n=1 Tax=Phlebotomus argentipes TaxID=94469 RepID=UPI00289376C4|nr:baculoviral IAP repeat-containing protein 5.2-B-like [Phlebotomus argentipes]
MNNNNFDYLFELQRLKSFKNWQFSKSKKCNERKMAQAGFYCTGSESAVCFVCGKELDGWEEEDDPWVEHKKHAPQCSFVKMRKKETDYTVKEFVILIETVLKNQEEKVHMDDVMKFRELMYSMRDKLQKNCRS